MAKLVDMKLPKPKKSDNKLMPADGPYMGETYPYGLQLRFDEEQTAAKLPILRKLDIDEEVTITARACVTSVNLDKRQGKDGSKERFSLTLQIEQIAISKINDAQESFDEATNKKG